MQIHSSLLLKRDMYIKAILNYHFGLWQRSNVSISHCVKENVEGPALSLIANGNVQHYIDNLSIFIKIFKIYIL